MHIITKVIILDTSTALLDRDQFYVPEHMTIVVVGDMMTFEMQKLVQDYFADMKQPEAVGEKYPDMGTIPKGTGIRVSAMSEKEVVDDDLWLDENAASVNKIT